MNYSHEAFRTSPPYSVRRRRFRYIAISLAMTAIAVGALIALSGVRGPQL